jgi:hypothetical protein
MNEKLQLFWGKIVKPGSPVFLDSPDSHYTMITGASLGDLSSDQTGTSVLTATIQTIHIDRIDPDSTLETVLGVLSAKRQEQVKLAHVFSPLNEVELSVSGPFDVHVSGRFIPIERHEEEESSEEEDEPSDGLVAEKLKLCIARR